MPRTLCRSSAGLCLSLLAIFLLISGTSIRAAEPAPRFEFTRMIAHWANYGDPAYLDFVDEARPELAQLGFYGAHYWSLSDTPFGKGYPAHFPVQGYDEAGKWFEEKNVELHKRGVKVIGHMNVKFLVGDPDGEDGPRGFFRFYQEDWDKLGLGPKPVKDPRDFLEVNAQGEPIVNRSYSIGKMPEYWACLNNPHWRAVLKAWTKRGIERGVDGFIANYFYRHDCHCEHCVAGFKQMLGERYTPAELKEKFRIADLKTHRFEEIVGWHKPEESTPLRREMLRFSQIANKRAFDEVFIEYGRSLKPDLIVAQWNHLGNFSQISGDERCMLPSDLWGKDETYQWYSTGGSAHFTDLEAGWLGEGTLHARYIRGAFDDKPFTLGKYESTRIRSAIAELAANGGAPMGFYTRFTDPQAREVIARYYSFMTRHDELYRGQQPAGEVLLLFPRSHVHDGDVEAVAAFREVGAKLLNEHILFDIRPDDMVSPEDRQQYPTIIDPAEPGDLKKLSSALSRFSAPETVRVSLTRPAGKANELTLHLVNYNREEPAKKRSAGGGIKDEKPIAADGITADLDWSDRSPVSAVTFLTPESDQPTPLKFRLAANRLKFEVPEFLVYAVIRIESK